MVKVNGELAVSNFIVENADLHDSEILTVSVDKTSKTVQLRLRKVFRFDQIHDRFEQSFKEVTLSLKGAELWASKEPNKFIGFDIVDARVDEKTLEIISSVGNLRASFTSIELIAFV